MLLHDGRINFLLRRRSLEGDLSLDDDDDAMLAVARALLTNPRVLILDEATEGLASLIRVSEVTAVADRLVPC